MASTNKTTHYELSQFIGTDKPAWLADYNADMSKIDTGINTAQTTATGADGKADANTIAIGTLENLSTDAKTSLVSAINEVDGHADTAQNTANSASSASTENGLAIQAINGYLNINTSSTPTATISGGTLTSSKMHSESNADGTLGKVYGTIIFNATTPTVTITIPSNLRPSVATTIEGAIFAEDSDGNDGFPAMTIATNGDVTVSISTSAGKAWKLWFPPVTVFC